MVEAAGGRIAVLVDGGFRRGTDIFKALALGADAVAVGRPYLWGLASFGEKGVATVLDIVHNTMPIAILDTSATAHMPDTLEMPYRPDIVGAGNPGEKKHTYRLGGLTCLAGDVIGDYSFDHELQVGERIVLLDMSHYTMVKTTTFNGTKLPAIALWNSETDRLEIVREFGYEDFKGRLS